MLQRGDDAAERAFARPAIVDKFQVWMEVFVFVGIGYDYNFLCTGPRQGFDLHEQRR
jgi:hypothetical protein